MNDLLGEVRLAEPNNNNQQVASEQDVELGGMGGGIGSGRAQAPTEKGQAMRGFFANVEAIKADMAEIRSLQREVLEMHERGKTIVKSKDMERHREAMQDAINEISIIAKKTKDKMEMQDKDNERAKQLKGQGKGSANERTRTTITAGLKKKLKDLMGEFSEMRTRIQAEYREVVERRVYTVTGQHVPEEQIDKLIESGEAESIFQKAIKEQGRGRVLDTLAEVQERHKAMKELEQSLLELHQIFLDMAVLVEAQGEMLDNIEKQVHSSVDYVAKGTSFLQSAKKIQHKTRKLMVCCAVIIIIIVIIVVLAYVKPWEVNNRRRLLLMRLLM